jgi:sulfate adenylyltransferase subunit 1 (EFTu-like GTPase family)
MPAYPMVCALARQNPSDMSLIDILLANAKPMVVFKADGELNYGKSFVSKYGAPATLHQVQKVHRNLPIGQAWTVLAKLLENRELGKIQIYTNFVP